MTLSYDYILVTRNEKDFAELLPAQQIENWIDSHL
jgi:predicted nucleic acid-binding protein